MSCSGTGVDEMPETLLAEDRQRCRDAVQNTFGRWLHVIGRMKLGFQQILECEGALQSLTREDPLTIGPLSTLNLKREVGVHQRCPTICNDDLAGNPASFFRREKGHGVADVGWRSQPTHRRPASQVPST